MTGPATPALARDLLRQAMELYRDNHRAASWLHRHLARFDQPVRLALLGQPGSGRSTLLDALATHWPAQRLTVTEIPDVDDEPTERSIQAGWFEADALVCLTPNPYRDDCTALHAAYEQPIAAATPVGSIAVVSRADEIGGGRVDALIAARRVARQFAHAAEVSDLSQDVVAVSGLVARTAGTLTADEFGVLRTLAGTSRAELDQQLLSVDRFVDPDNSVPLAVSTRESLLERFGLFGLRLATTLIRQGAHEPASLAAQLAKRSGMTELNAAVQRYFLDHAGVLKARGALIALDTVLRSEPRPGAERLVAELERLLARAHEYRELRLLGDLNSGRIALPDELAAEAARLVGGEGTHPVPRLALDASYEPSHPRFQQALFGALWRWREHAANPALGAAQRTAARTVVRTCEAMANDLLGV